MKKFYFTLAVITVFGMLFVGCPNETDGNNEKDNKDKKTLGKIVGVRSNQSKSFFTGVVSGNDAVSRASNNSSVILDSALLFVNAEGQTEPIRFVDSNGNEVMLNIEYIKKITDEAVLATYNGAVFLSNDSSSDVLSDLGSKQSIGGNCLINFLDGKVYDLKDYDIKASIYSQGNLFVMKGATLYKIDLSDPSQAIPLNNPEYLGVSAPLFVTDNWVLASCNGNWGLKLLDVEGRKAPVMFDEENQIFEEDDFFDGFSATISGRRFFIDGKGQMWRVVRHTEWSVESGKNSYKGYYYRYNINENGIPYTPDESPSVLPDVFCIDGYHLTGEKSYAEYYSYVTEEWFAYDYDNTDKNYYVTIKAKKEGGLDFHYEELPYNGDIFLNNSDSSSFSSFDYQSSMYMDGALYGFMRKHIGDGNGVFYDEQEYSDTMIYKIEMFTGIKNEVYEIKNLATPKIIASCGRIIFYQYEDAVTVGTYSIVPGETIPKKISSSNMEIQNVIELSF